MNGASLIWNATIASSAPAGWVASLRLPSNQLPPARSRRQRDRILPPGSSNMRIAAAADLHFSPQSYDRIREPMSHVRDEADVLVLAGDLTNYGKREEMESLLNALVRLRIPTIAVLGNHDYESGQHEELMKMMVTEGIKVLDGSRYERDGVGFA